MLNKRKVPYILFSISNSFYLIISEEDSFLKEMIIELKHGKIHVISTDSIDKSNKLFLNVFNKNNYHKEFIGFESDYFKNGYKEANGNMIYFVMKDIHGDRYGETCLSLIVKPLDFNISICSSRSGKTLL